MLKLRSGRKMRISSFSSAAVISQPPRPITSFASFYSCFQNKLLHQDRLIEIEGHSGCVTSVAVLGWLSRRQYSTEIKGNKEKNYYKVLGVTPNCSKSRIKVAYYKLSKKYHPDVNKTEEAKQKFQDISEAYDVLSNAISRQQYDKERSSSSPHYRSNVTHGQEKYKAKIIYPMGRSSTYNFDEWHDRHYQSSLSEALKQKRVRDSHEAAEKYEYVQQKMTQEVKDTPFLPLLAIATVLTMFGIGYMFMRQKLQKLQNTVKKEV